MMIGAGNRTGLGLFAVALYGGPVLAGMAGHGALALPVFAALFLLYVVAARQPDLRTEAGWLSLGLLAAVQSALVVLCWAVGLMLGQGLQGLVGPVILPLWAPVAVTALAAFLGAWALRDAAEMDVFLDSALARISEMERDGAQGMAHATSSYELAWPVPDSRAEARVDQALAKLRALEAGNSGQVDHIARRLAAEVGPAGFDPLYDAAARYGANNEPAVDLALLRFAAAPDVFETLVSRGEAGLAPTLLLGAPDPDVRASARALVERLLAEALEPEDLPDLLYLDDLAHTFPGEGYEALKTRCAAR